MDEPVDQPVEQPVDQAEQLADAFVTASRALVGLAVHSINAAPVELTVAQHRLLVLVAAHGAQTVGDIAEELGINPSNASRHCDRLQRQGLVDRHRSANDGRSVEVTLTPAGREVIDAVTEQRRGEVLRVLAKMPPTDAALLVQALQGFTDAAGELTDSQWAVQHW